MDPTFHLFIHNFLAVLIWVLVLLQPQSRETQLNRSPQFSDNLWVSFILKKTFTSLSIPFQFWPPFSDFPSSQSLPHFSPSQFHPSFLSLSLKTLESSLNPLFISYPIYCLSAKSCHLSFPHISRIWPLLSIITTTPLAWATSISHLDSCSNFFTGPVAAATLSRLLASSPD